jgi:hypothetical protein
MGRKGVEVLTLVALFTALALPAWAQGKNANTQLQGFEEVPAISTPATGRFTARINHEAETISYELSYTGLQGSVTQAHIHFAQEGVNGAIVIFLCSNLGNGPAGTQPCPPSPGSISGTADAGDVLAVSAQGIGAGQMHKVLRAIRSGIAYVNVHSTLFPGGEIRGQLDLRGKGAGDALLEGIEADETEEHHH